MKSKTKSLCAILFAALLCLPFAHSQADDEWSTTLSVGFSVPFFYSEIEDDVTARFDRTGGGLALGAFLVFEPNGLTVMARLGLGYAQSDVKGYSDTFRGGDLYFMVGVGKRLSLGRLHFIPSVGVGLEADALFAKYKWDTWQKFDEGVLSVAFLLCSDLTAQFMLTPRLGLEFSCMVSTNLFGGATIGVDRTDESDDTSYYLKFGMCNVVPALLVCMKF